METSVVIFFLVILILILGLYIFVGYMSISSIRRSIETAMYRGRNHILLDRFAKAVFSYPWIAFLYVVFWPITVVLFWICCININTVVRKWKQLLSPVQIGR